jgi:predicted phosphodiesterase
MTRLAILSDIHGNLPALQAVMHDLTQHKPDHIIVADDVINWGSFSRECVEIVYAPEAYRV